MFLKLKLKFKDDIFYSTATRNFSQKIFTSSPSFLTCMCTFLIEYPNILLFIRFL
jgi:hypothetical protein